MASQVVVRALRNGTYIYYIPIFGKLSLPTPPLLSPRDELNGCRFAKLTE